MDTRYKFLLGVVAGALAGGVAVHGLHAQSKPKAYLITESEVLDAAALAAYAPVTIAVQRAAGGRPGIVPANGRVIPLVGEAPRRISVSEWDSLEQLQAWYNSPERKALTPQREKAFKTVRQFMVERPAD